MIHQNFRAASIQFPHAKLRARNVQLRALMTLRYLVAVDTDEDRSLSIKLQGAFILAPLRRNASLPASRRPAVSPQRCLSEELAAPEQATTRIPAMIRRLYEELASTLLQHHAWCPQIWPLQVINICEQPPTRKNRTVVIKTRRDQRIEDSILRPQTDA